MLSNIVCTSLGCGAAGVLLDAASALVERVAGQADDVEGVHHRGRVGELLRAGPGSRPGRRPPMDAVSLSLK
jgi:hypothetical protein